MTRGPNESTRAEFCFSLVSLSVQLFNLVSDSPFSLKNTQEYLGTLPLYAAPCIGCPTSAPRPRRLSPNLQHDGTPIHPDRLYAHLLDQPTR